MVDENEVSMPSLQANDGKLNVELTVTVDEVKARIDKVILSDAAGSKEVLQAILEGVKEAKAKKMQAESIIGIVESSLEKAISFVI